MLNKQVWQQLFGICPRVLVNFQNRIDHNFVIPRTLIELSGLTTASIILSVVFESGLNTATCWSYMLIFCQRMGHSNFMWLSRNCAACSEINELSQILLWQTFRRALLRTESVMNIVIFAFYSLMKSNGSGNIIRGHVQTHSTISVGEAYSQKRLISTKKAKFAIKEA